MNSSTATNSPITARDRVHPGSAARLTRIGPAAAARGPGTARNEARAKRSPEQWIRRADRPQPSANRDAIHHVDERLHQELAADAVRCFVEGLGGDGEVAMADHTDDATPQLLALQQQEDYQRDDESRR